MFLKNRNISSKIKISKVTDYAAFKVKGKSHYGVVLHWRGIFKNGCPQFVIVKFKGIYLSKALTCILTFS